MKHNIKTTLLTAIPCLALSLFAVSCSDDDSAVVPENNTKGKTISFTAVAPEVTDYTTRIGLDETSLPSSSTDPEPIIWLEGDKIAFNFVKYKESVGQVIEYTATNVRNGGLACDFRTDQEMNLEDGLYQVYVVGPSIATTFQGGAVSGTSIDLRGQSQPGVTTNYRNLSDYYYQHAYTVLQVEDNEVVYGSTSLTFHGLTSMLRYRVTSALTSDVHVVKIKFSHLGTSESQFYTRGAFDPSSNTSIVPVGSPVSSLGLTTAQPLSPSSQFNAYMTLLPTEGFASGNLDQLSATVYFYLGGVLYKRIWDWSAPLISDNGTFPVSSRFMFGLTLRPSEYVPADFSELLDEEEGPITPPVIAPTGVTITSQTSSFEVAVNKTLNLIAKIEPEGATGTIVWSSDDESVAIVNQSGVVTGKSDGSATITATIDGTTISNSRSITVSYPIIDYGFPTVQHGGYAFTTNSYLASVQGVRFDLGYYRVNYSTFYTFACPPGWSKLNSHALDALPLSVRTDLLNIISYSRGVWSTYLNQDLIMGDSFWFMRQDQWTRSYDVNANFTGGGGNGYVGSLYFYDARCMKSIL